MLELLHKALLELPSLMLTTEGWNSVDVTYHPPRVERLWCQSGEYRILLHRIHPCDPGEALAHPHPWPSAVRIMSGQYEHKSGWGDHERRFHVSSTAYLGAGSEYEMVNPEGWHAVRPIGKASDSVMVIGPLYEPRVVMPHVPVEKQGPLDPKRFEELFLEWKERAHDYVDRVDPPIECGNCIWVGRESKLAYSHELSVDHAKCPKCGSLDVEAMGRR